ncbi:hypothetical protein I3760_14G078700 [Carya illinoinensis]|nr:hypothetical protein I3760_14G078700 [Carya illinoinensis]
MATEESKPKNRHPQSLPPRRGRIKREMLKGIVNLISKFKCSRSLDRSLRVFITVPHRAANLLPHDQHFTKAQISRHHTGLAILLLSLMSGFNEDNMASHAQHKPGQG